MFYLNALGIICPIGAAKEEVTTNLLHRVASGVCDTTRHTYNRALPLGIVHQEFPIDHTIPLTHQSRNNRMALAALKQIQGEIDEAIHTYGRDRVAIVVGSSTSGVSEGESAYFARQQLSHFPPSFHYHQQEIGSLSAFLSDTLKTSGVAFTHSCACASSAKAMASAARLLRMNVCDAVITGGVDTLSEFVVSGFSSLDSVSHQRCNPLSANRNGINLGEGAALFLMSKKPSSIYLSGWGETSDGYHISAPDPSGAGAFNAMSKALARARVLASDLDYINLHGTATIQNDAMEAKAIHQLVADHVPVSSTKPFTGHTLGAAGAVEAALCWLAMQDENDQGILPPHLWDHQQDASLPKLNIAEPHTRLNRPLRKCLSNSFAFGGANVSLLFERVVS